MTTPEESASPAAQARSVAEWITSLNLEGLDVSELRRGASIVEALTRAEVSTERGRPTASLKCDNYYCRAVTCGEVVWKP
jgi:hypothetical protein